MIAELVTASRPVSWINTAYPFAAAYWLATREVDARLVIGTLFFLVPYNLAMYGINDVFDHASDVANPRKGGAQGAVLPPSEHRAVLIAAAVLCVPFVVVLVVLGSPLSWLVLAISLLAVVGYSAPPMRWKVVPFLDSLTSSTHFVSPAVYGIALAGAAPTAGTIIVLCAFLLWGIASHAFGAVQDVEPDRTAGLGSIATALGAARTVRLAIVLWLAAGGLMLAAGWPAALAAALVLPYVATAMPYRRVADADAADATRGWRVFLWLNYLAGFGVTMLIIVTVLLE